MFFQLHIVRRLSYVLVEEQDSASLHMHLTDLTLHYNNRPDWTVFYCLEEGLQYKQVTTNITVGEVPMLRVTSRAGVLTRHLLVGVCSSPTRCFRLLTEGVTKNSDHSRSFKLRLEALNSLLWSSIPIPDVQGPQFPVENDLTTNVVEQDNNSSNQVSNSINHDINASSRNSRTDAAHIETMIHSNGARGPSIGLENKPHSQPVDEDQAVAGSGFNEAVPDDSGHLALMEAMEEQPLEDGAAEGQWQQHSIEFTAAETVDGTLSVFGRLQRERCPTALCTHSIAVGTIQVSMAVRKFSEANVTVTLGSRQVKLATRVANFMGFSGPKSDATPQLNHLSASTVHDQSNDSHGDSNLSSSSQSDEVNSFGHSELKLSPNSHRNTESNVSRSSDISFEQDGDLKSSLLEDITKILPQATNHANLQSASHLSIAVWFDENRMPENVLNWKTWIVKYGWKEDEERRILSTVTHPSMENDMSLRGFLIQQRGDLRASLKFDPLGDYQNLQLHSLHCRRLQGHFLVDYRAE
ncbi:hypothetical protein FHG87_024152, partial [Trinorchestia longiramus]